MASLEVKLKEAELNTKRLVLERDQLRKAYEILPEQLRRTTVPAPGH